MLYVVEKEDRARPRPLAARTALPDRALPVPAQAPQGPSQTCIGTWQLRSMGSQASSARVWVCVLLLLLLLLLWSFFFPPGKLASGEKEQNAAFVSCFFFFFFSSCSVGPPSYPPVGRQVCVGREDRERQGRKGPAEAPVCEFF